jgi:hypothetical protein
MEAFDRAGVIRRALGKYGLSRLVFQRTMLTGTGIDGCEEYHVMRVVEEEWPRLLDNRMRDQCGLL